MTTLNKKENITVKSNHLDEREKETKKLISKLIKQYYKENIKTTNGRVRRHQFDSKKNKAIKMTAALIAQANQGHQLKDIKNQMNNSTHLQKITCNTKAEKQNEQKMLSYEQFSALCPSAPEPIIVRNSFFKKIQKKDFKNNIN